MSDRSNIERAIAAHLREPGAQQPSARSSITDTVDGREYVRLANTSGTLAVYRVRKDGHLRKLKRWPKKLDEL